METLARACKPRFCVMADEAAAKDLAVRLGDTGITGIKIKNTATGEESELTLDGVFVAIGQMPDNKPFQGVCDLDSAGFIVADETCLTKTPGVFVAGDCRVKGVRQIATAVGDGAAASLAACRYLNSLTF